MFVFNERIRREAVAVAAAAAMTSCRREQSSLSSEQCCQHDDQLARCCVHVSAWLIACCQNARLFDSRQNERTDNRPVDSGRRWAPHEPAQQGTDLRMPCVTFCHTLTSISTQHALCRPILVRSDPQHP